MFQSTPVIANGRIVLEMSDYLVTGKFQSTPVIANGRISKHADMQSSNAQVSIHARYC